jgi:hypothetical protein
MTTMRIVVSKQIQRLLLLLLPISVLLSGTRSQYVAFAIALFPFLFWVKFLKTNFSKILILCSFVFVVVFFNFFYIVVESMLSPDNANPSGSTLEMRTTQFLISFYYFLQNPLWGNGRNYIWEVVRPLHPALYGAESVWFQLMVDYGIVGCLSYLLIVFMTGRWASKYSKTFAFYAFAFLVAKTLSIVIGVEINMLLITSIIVVKIHQYKNNFTVV